MEDQKLSIKVSLNDEPTNIRRFSFAVKTQTYQDLVEQLSQLFWLPPQITFTIKYCDPDSDLITISSDIELEEAINIQKETKLLRLFLEKTTQPLSGTTCPLCKRPLDLHQQQEKEKEKENGLGQLKKTTEEFITTRAEEKFQKRLEKIQERQAKNAQKLMVKQQRRELKLQKRLEQKAMKQQRQTKTALVGRLVEHVSIPDNSIVVPNSEFTKIWKFRNDGLNQWPAGTRFMFIGKGNNLSSVSSVLVNDGDVVLPGSEIEIKVPMIAPASEGTYLGFWRLCTAESHKFGHKVWIKIQVQNPPSTIQQQQEQQEQQNHQDEKVEEKQEQVVEKQEEEPQPQPQLQEQLENKVEEEHKQPENEVQEKKEEEEAESQEVSSSFVIPSISDSVVNALTNDSFFGDFVNLPSIPLPWRRDNNNNSSTNETNYESQLKALEEMGFVTVNNEDHCKELLQKHKGDVQVVVSCLLSE